MKVNNQEYSDTQALLGLLPQSFYAVDSNGGYTFSFFRSMGLAPLLCTGNFVVCRAKLL